MASKPKALKKRGPRFPVEYTPGKVGRPGYKPSPADRSWVRDMVRVGIPLDRIASFFGVAEMTIKQHFAFELETGRASLLTVVGRNMANLSETSATAGMFVLQNLMPGVWKDRRRVSGDAPPDRPDLTMLTDDQLEVLRQAAALLEPPTIEGEAVEVPAETDETDDDDGEAAA